MKIDLGRLSYDPVWYDFDTGDPTSDQKPDGHYLQIKPVPFSEMEIILREGDMLISGRSLCKMFKGALTGMNGFTDANNNPIPCTDSVKQKLFDFKLGGISDFVVNKCWEFFGEKEDDEKNS